MDRQKTLTESYGKEIMEAIAQIAERSPFQEERICRNCGTGKEGTAKVSHLFDGRAAGQYTSVHRKQFLLCRRPVFVGHTA
ncbi:hypothetical protein AALD01_12985 [Oscillospiraceae bacterium 21-37]